MNGKKISKKKINHSKSQPSPLSSPPTSKSSSHSPPTRFEVVEPSNNSPSIIHRYSSEPYVSTHLRLESPVSL